MTVDTTVKSGGEDRSRSGSGEEEERRTPDGLIRGGRGVNEGFENTLKNVLGRKFVEDFQREYLINWLLINQSFESCKMRHHADETQPYVIRDTNKLKEVYEYTTGQPGSFAQAFEEADCGLHFSADVTSLKLTPETMTGYFDNVVNDIIAHIQNHMEGVKAVYMSGGFCNSKFLRERIREAFSEHGFPIIFAKNPEKAVMVGALHMALAQENLAIHAVDADYGVATLDFDPKDPRSTYHVLDRNKKVLSGRVYQQTLPWADIQSKEVRVYRNRDQQFMTFKFEKKYEPEVTQRAHDADDDDDSEEEERVRKKDEPDFHVQMQVTGNHGDAESGQKKIQVSVTNKLTHECHEAQAPARARRENTPSSHDFRNIDRDRCCSYCHHQT